MQYKLIKIYEGCHLSTGGIWRQRKTDVWDRYQKRVQPLKDLLDNRKQRILSAIRNSEELRRGTLEQLEKA
jgi:hypothetical protein